MVICSLVIPIVSQFHREKNAKKREEIIACTGCVVNYSVVVVVVQDD